MMNKLTIAVFAVLLAGSSAAIAEFAKINAMETRTIAPTTHLVQGGKGYITFSSFGDPVYTDHGTLTLYDLNGIETNAAILPTLQKKLAALKKNNPNANRVLVITQQGDMTQQSTEVLGTKGGMQVFYDTSSGRPVYNLDKVSAVYDF